MATTPSSNLDFQNFYSGQLTADITAGSLTLNLDTVPTPSEGILVIEPDSTANREIIYYTSKGVNSVTCPADGRGWDSTTATSHLTGSTVIMAPVAYMMRILMNGLGIFAKTVKYNVPQGHLQNGQISASVSSNNLTVAIKGLDGTDPSPTNPVIVRIGNSLRTITAALSVTKNAGTNWFAAGGDFATKEIDYFVYLGYNSTDGVVIGFSRIPWGRTYGDFSTTTTNEKYAAISTITNATSTDEYEVVGRFNATLSASTSYNWSIPATAIVVNRPIFETRWLDYVPTATNLTFGNGTLTSRYKIAGDRRIEFRFILQLGSTSSVGSNPAINLPISASSAYVGGAVPEYANVGVCKLLHSGISDCPGVTTLGGTTTFNPIALNASGTYTTVAGLSSTIPFTWATGDAIFCMGTYEAA